MKNENKGFSLIELSIVLIIIGLLVAGITGGASLIKSGQVRSIISEARNYKMAVNAYYASQDKLPGDGYVDASGSDDGDLDGHIEAIGANVAEGVAAWVDLEEQSIIDTGIAGADIAAKKVVVEALTHTTASPCDLGSTTNTNMVASKSKGNYWTMDWDSTMRNVLVITGQTNGAQPTVTAAASDAQNQPIAGTTNIIKGLTALAIDTKMDDGIVSSGSVKTYGTSCTYADNDQVCTLAIKIGI